MRCLRLVADWLVPDATSFTPIFLFLVPNIHQHPSSPVARLLNPQFSNLPVVYHEAVAATFCLRICDKRALIAWQDGNNQTAHLRPLQPLQPLPLQHTMPAPTGNKKLGQKVDIDFTLRKVFGKDSFR